MNPLAHERECLLFFSFSLCRSYPVIIGASNGNCGHQEGIISALASTNTNYFPLACRAGGGTHANHSLFSVFSLTGPKHRFDHVTEFPFGLCTLPVMPCPGPHPSNPPGIATSSAISRHPQTVCCGSWYTVRPCSSSANSDAEDRSPDVLLHVYIWFHFYLRFCFSSHFPNFSLNSMELSLRGLSLSAPAPPARDPFFFPLPHAPHLLSQYPYNPFSSLSGIGWGDSSRW